MNIKFILNGEEKEFRSEANVRLIDILRSDFGLLGAKAGCLAGKCGLCTVLFNGNIIHACLIPAFKMQGSEIITIEGFAETVEYRDIITGFAEANLHNCDYCKSSKILNTGALLGKNNRPSKQEILAAFNGIMCRCTDPHQLVEGIEKTADIRQRRLYGR
ncbi:MAG: 2Fe-2S iron-sulfur cluster-binding protein [Treponema sp.]|nr:2Fe-2S iron-sulfur cluster-binding protein [Treponema sp.]